MKQQSSDQPRLTRAIVLRRGGGWPAGRSVSALCTWNNGVMRPHERPARPHDLLVVLPFWCSHHSSGAVWESRWPSWAVRPNTWRAFSGFRGRKAILNHASALVSACSQYVNWHPRTLSITSTCLPTFCCWLKCCFTSTETVLRFIRAGRESRTPMSTFTQQSWALLFG